MNAPYRSDELRDPSAPWRPRSSFTLSESLTILTEGGFNPTIASRAEHHLCSTTALIRGGSPVEFLDLRSTAFPAAGIVGPGREVDDGVRELVFPLSQTVSEVFLVVSNGQTELEIPVISGDWAALSAYGWSDESTGRRAELRVSGAMLDQALRRLETAPAAN